MPSSSIAGPLYGSSKHGHGIMTPSNLHAWRTYLATRSHEPHLPYRYPASEDITDASETHQDPMKRQREVESLSRAVLAHAELVCDFGCGLGRNFGTLRHSASEDALLIGIEPDARRRQIAARNPYGFHVIPGSIEFIEEAPDSCRIDHFLCCQILGHTSISATREIITTALSRLSDVGTAHFCVPFINAALHDSTHDFFHLVHLRRNPDDPEFRIRLAQDEFDRITEGTAIQMDVLPVRAFATHIPEDFESSSIPIALDEPPIAFDLPIVGSFRSTTTIYSVHAWHGDTPHH